MLRVGLLLSYFSIILCTPVDQVPQVKATCGYQTCHPVDPVKLNVHLIPHSHDDVGWRKTFDQYYYGNKISEHPGVRGVQNILDSVMQSLKDDTNRRFVQAETTFFARWWQSQSDEIKDLVKNLVNTGRLEMVGGGWSQNDEATTNYQSIIDQLTLGLRTLEELLGECGRPRVGWQIDPFGHTNAMATIFAQLGFDGLFFARLDYRDVEEREKTKKTEFIWRGNSDLGSQSDIFTSLIFENYSAPYNFCWDIQCGDLPIIDDKDSVEYNVDKRVEEFTERIMRQASKYKTNNIMITMGGDFTFQAAEMYYINIDRLIKGFKDLKPEINVIYSTPSCYIKAVNEAAKLKTLDFSLKTDDFMPYASDEHSCWTGFFTSRPSMKRMERLGNNLLQVAQQLVVFGNARADNFNEDLTDLKKAMGIMQHHDAITGTEKQHVANDYIRMLAIAMKNAQKSIHKIVFNLLKIRSDEEQGDVQLDSCLLSNVSRCGYSNLDRFTVALYNPHSRYVSDYVRIPVPSANYTVVGLDGGVVPHQISPVIHTFDLVPGDKSWYELTFYAQVLPPHGVNYFYVTKLDEDINEPDLIKPVEKFNLGTNTTGFLISKATGLLETITLNGATVPVKQQFYYYKSADGDNNGASSRASGAYVFRPKDNVAVSVTDKADVKVYEGQLFDEVHQKFNDWVRQIIRVYKETNHIVFDWIVGPLPNDDKIGKEVISRFITDLKTNSTFYTDSNGRQLIKRVRNHRDTFEYTNEEPVSGNYYPVTSRIVLKDEEKKIDFAILNDRSQAGTSLHDGEIELMIHRRLMKDDDFGVNEVLTETEYNQGITVRGQHYLVLGTESAPGAVQQHDLSQKILLSPWPFFGDAMFTEFSYSNLRNKLNFQFSGLTHALPENVRILTLELLSNTTLLLRLEHHFSSEEDATLGQEATVDLTELFTTYDILSINETTLGANQNKSDNVRLTWTIESNGETEETPEKAAEGLSITLMPMEIKTFILEVKPVLRPPYPSVANIHFSNVFVTLLLVLVCIFH